VYRRECHKSISFPFLGNVTECLKSKEDLYPHLTLSLHLNIVSHFLI
jgi:hypothetical protein